MNKFYIYRHIRLDNNTPFYIGKGQNRRAYVKSGRNNYWIRIVNRCGYRVEILLDNLNEVDAWEKEMYFIKIYKDINLCEANITIGGEGTTGLIHTSESKNKIKNAMINKYKGKIHNKQSRKNMSLGSKGQKSTRGIKHTQIAKNNMAIGHGAHEFNVYEAICIQKPIPKLGKIGVYNKDKKIATFINQNEAAEKFNVNQSDISLCLRSKIKQVKGYIFEYIDKDVK